MNQSRIKCDIICYSNYFHLQQIYTGLILLHKLGIIKLNQKLYSNVGKEGRKYLHNNRRFFLKLVVNDKITVSYDVKDSFAIDEEVLHESDLYFKRSYWEQHYKELKNREKIFPLGLNYLVYYDNFDKYAFMRSIALSTDIKRLALDAFGSLGVLKKLFFRPRRNFLEAYPNYQVSPRVLFMVRLWDPKEAFNLSEEKMLEREKINEMRIRCLDLLKKEFGQDFYGGLVHTDYAIKNFKNYLLSDSGSSNKKNYLDTLKLFPICISTTGLHNSIGWKLGEYVAFSKSIVSEKIIYRTPGEFKAERNYLEFSTPEECVEKASRLFEERDLRYELMSNNYEYYHSYVRPDSLVLNTLILAIREMQR